MAQKIHHIDDLDGREAHETLQFGLDGKFYEIDLHNENAAMLRDALGRYVAKARVVQVNRPGRGGGRAKAVRHGASTAVIRDWALKHGHEVSSRGRIPIEVEKAYYAANK